MVGFNSTTEVSKYLSDLKIAQSQKLTPFRDLLDNLQSSKMNITKAFLFSLDSLHVIYKKTRNKCGRAQKILQ